MFFFLLQSRNTHLRLTGDSKLPTGMNVCVWVVFLSFYVVCFYECATRHPMSAVNRFYTTVNVSSTLEHSALVAYLRIKSGLFLLVSLLAVVYCRCY